MEDDDTSDNEDRNKCKVKMDIMINIRLIMQSMTAIRMKIQMMM